MTNHLNIHPEMRMNDNDPLISLLNRAMDMPDHCCVVLPEELDGRPFAPADLYGYLRMETGYHVIYSWGDMPRYEDLETEWVGAICENAEAEARTIERARQQDMPGCLLGRRGENDVLSLFIHRMDDGLEIELEKKPFSWTQNVFSRHSGLLETDWLSQLYVVVTGAGSVGSRVIDLLARSGVGRIAISETDCMEIHNDCRHQLTLREVGLNKADALARHVRRINPDIDVRVFRRRIQDVPLSELSDWIGDGKALFLGCCDNRAGNASACDAAKALNAPFASLGFWERAWGGELFVYLPIRGDVCYRCVFSKYIDNEIDQERRNRMYVGENRAAQAKIVPGIAVDIEYGVSLFCKIALDILNLGREGYQPRLLFNIGQLNWFCGTADRSAGDQWKTALPDPLSLRPINLSDSLRTCESCSGKTA
ncbi:MAG: ThiF family adenylyltransferase [Clostridia bacterium]|nr:ThiF family adenylyltransferase [Clostridia bacterium]